MYIYLEPPFMTQNKGIFILQGGPLPVIHGVYNPYKEGEITPITHLFAAMYWAEITP